MKKKYKSDKWFLDMDISNDSGGSTFLITKKRHLEGRPYSVDVKVRPVPSLEAGGVRWITSSSMRLYGRENNQHFFNIMTEPLPAKREKFESLYCNDYHMTKRMLEHDTLWMTIAESGWVKTENISGPDEGFNKALLHLKELVAFDQDIKEVISFIENKLSERKTIDAVLPSIVTTLPPDLLINKVGSFLDATSVGGLAATNKANAVTINTVKDAFFSHSSSAGSERATVPESATPFFLEAAEPGFSSVSVEQFQRAYRDYQTAKGAPCSGVVGALLNDDVDFATIFAAARSHVPGVEEVLTDLGIKDLLVIDAKEMAPDPEKIKRDLVAELETRIEVLGMALWSPENQGLGFQEMEEDQEIDALDALIGQLSTTDTPVAQVVHAFRAEHPFLDEGKHSHRTKDLLNKYDPEGPAR